MKLRTLIVASTTLATSTLMHGGFTPTSAAERELAALDQAWIDAEVQHDRAALEQILDEKCIVTFASGKSVDRATFIAGILGREIKPFEVLHEDMKVHGDTAVVIDTTLDQQTKFIWIAIKKSGHWRVISETFVRVSPPK